MTKTNNTSNWKSELKSLIIVISLAMLIRIFIIELFVVPTASMRATILIGDYILSTKYSYGYSRYSIPFKPNLFSGRIFAHYPERGDVIIMQPPHDMQNRYVKRLIGLPGEKIQIINDLIYINDKPIKRVEVGNFINEQDGEEYIKFKETLPDGISFFSYKLKHPNYLATMTHGNFGPYYVPRDHFFFLGDNRDESKDSRFELGMVPFENLIAKARFIIFSTKEWLWVSGTPPVEQVKRLWTWLASIRFDRLFTSDMYHTDSAENE